MVLFLQLGNDFICGSFSLPSLLSEVIQHCNVGSPVLKTPQALQSAENTTVCKWYQGRPVVIFNPSIFYLFAENFELHFVKQVEKVSESQWLFLTSESFLWVLLIEQGLFSLMDLNRQAQILIVVGHSGFVNRDSHVFCHGNVCSPFKTCIIDCS